MSDDVDDDLPSHCETLMSDAERAKLAEFRRRVDGESLLEQLALYRRHNDYLFKLLSASSCRIATGGALAPESMLAARSGGLSPAAAAQTDTSAAHD